MTNAASASALLKPYDAHSMRCFPVSSRVNLVANDNEECAKRVQISELQHRLFRSMVATF